MTFYICSSYFINGKNKQTKKTATKLAKIPLKTQLQIVFPVKLKLSEAFGRKIIFWTKAPNFILVS